MTYSVVRLASTPTKGTALILHRSVEVGVHGVVGDRLFYLIGSSGQLINGRRWGPVVQVRSDYHGDSDELVLHFPDGRVLRDTIRVGRKVRTNFYDHDVCGRIVLGPWSSALSELADRDLTLVKVVRPSIGVDLHPVTIVSTASLDCLAAASTVTADAFWRRFRLNVELSGPQAHEEDAWAGRYLQLGSVRLEVIGPIPRCAVVRQNPTTGRRDGDVLRELLTHSSLVHGAETRAPGREPELGVYARVLEPGWLSVGSPGRIKTDQAVPKTRR